MSQKGIIRKHFKVTTLFSSLFMGLLLVFVFNTSTQALLLVPSEASLISIEESLETQVHPVIVISSAWVIDFPSEVKRSFYQVIALVGEDQVEKTFFLDPITFELVDEALIESFREQEANATDPVIKITGVEDNAATSNNNLWMLPLLALITALGAVIFKDSKPQSNH